ncbi:tetratricopeptide repeat protein [Parashewanella tropica]|uniref:tetratricopeptide repeat-containing glycosyltransferase family protein n=1 Tax=Parashewanella tropica TaxID=2547970 RepID=UPI001059E0E7|nr:tetratricopeptide repeat protein [Parashewanella tropica]
MNVQSDNSDVLFTQAIQLHQQGKIEQAHSCYQQLLFQKPNHLSAWINLGVLNRRLKRYELALLCYQRALAINPDDAGILSNMANVLKDNNRVEHAIYHARKAVDIDPENVTFRHNLAIALREGKQFEASLQELDTCLSKQADNPNLQWDRSLVLLMMQKFSEGFPAFEARWKTGDLPPPNVPSHCKRWQGQPFKGEKLLLLTEQGFGDTIFCARYILLASQLGGEVILECKSPLMRLFSTLSVTLLSVDAERDGIDWYCPVMSLPGLFLGQEPLPPKLYAPESITNHLSERLLAERQHLQVGIIWSGSVTYGDNDKRSISLSSLLPIFESLPEVRFYSLQKGPKESDLKELGIQVLVPDFGSELDDFADTAAVLKQLDLLVMTDSACAHLAGSIDTPIINLLQYKPGWMYFPETYTCRWYPSMRILRQQTPGDWEPVLDQLQLLLSELATNKHQNFQHTDVLTILDKFKTRSTCI